MPEENGRVIFTGSYVHKRDDKGRLPVPFRWRPKGSVEFMLVVWTKHQAGVCIRGMLPTEYEKMYTRIEAMPNEDPNKDTLMRAIGAASAVARQDSVGRITIPPEMAEEAGIVGEAVLVGMVSRFEIWNPQRYEQVRAQDKAVLNQAMRVM